MLLLRHQDTRSSNFLAFSDQPGGHLGRPGHTFLPFSTARDHPALPQQQQGSTDTLGHTERAKCALNILAVVPFGDKINC